MIATNLTSICCVYKEKIVKKRLVLKNVASIQIEKVATFNSDRKIIKLIPNKSFRYYKQSSSIVFRLIWLRTLPIAIIYVTNIYVTNIYITTIYITTIYITNIYLTNIFVTNIYVTNIYLTHIYEINIHVTNIYIINIYVIHIYVT